MSQYNEIEATGMRPKLGQTSLVLPITFDYSGGRGAKAGSRKIWAILLSIIAVIFGVGTMLKKSGFFLSNFLLGLALMYGVLFIVRFVFLKEGQSRREEIEMEDNDFKKQIKTIWGIYEISPLYPYICRFRNGKSGVIVRLNKDVILGKYSESEFEHYEAISDAYNICGSSKIQMCHVDYMDNIGMDERLDTSFEKLTDVDNVDIRDLLTDIFSYQRELMLERLTTFDVYVFMWQSNDRASWNVVRKILSCFMDANYRSFQLLRESDLGELTKVIFNLEDFSVLSAELNAFEENTEGSANIVPISVHKADGEVVKLGKTREELAEEARLEAKREEMRKQAKSSKGSSNSDLDDEIVDI